MHNRTIWHQWNTFLYKFLLQRMKKYMSEGTQHFLINFLDNSPQSSRAEFKYSILLVTVAAAESIWKQNTNIQTVSTTFFAVLHAPLPNLRLAYLTSLTGPSLLTSTHTVKGIQCKTLLKWCEKLSSKPAKISKWCHPLIRRSVADRVVWFLIRSAEPWFAPHSLHSMGSGQS